jgi:hypothetical protein
MDLLNRHFARGHKLGAEMRKRESRYASIMLAHAVRHDENPVNPMNAPLKARTMAVNLSCVSSVRDAGRVLVISLMRNRNSVASARTAAIAPASASSVISF